MSPIKLMPAYRRGGYNPYTTAKPITGEHPALIRSPRSGHGRYEVRWHRVKSAETYAAGHTIVHVWCGQAVGADDAFTTDEALDGFPVCGACGVLVPIRTGREYSQPAQMLKIHAPGSELVPPCEQHAWDDLGLDNERAVCRCERDGGRDGA